MTDQRIALVTGGAGGIGRAIAARLARDGYRPVLADLDLERTQAVAVEIGGEAIRLDVTDSAAVDAGVDGVVARHGRLDLLVNNAGAHIQKLVAEMTDDEWDMIQRVNARGVFVVSRAAVRHMMREDAGRIVNIATKLGFGNPYSSAYMASKNAIWGFTQCLAVEMAPYGVTVNAVAPGHVGPGTGFEKAWFAKAEKLGMPWPEFEKQVLKTIPAGPLVQAGGCGRGGRLACRPGCRLRHRRNAARHRRLRGLATTPPREAR